MNRSRSFASRPWTTALVTAGGAVLLLLSLLVVAHWAPLQELDDGIERDAHRAVVNSSATLSLARALTHLGDPLAVSLTTVLLALALVAFRRYRAALYVAAVRVVVIVATAGLKSAVARPRPDEVHPIAVAHGYSFPSGHASGTAALWCSLAVLIASRTRRAVVAAVAVVVPVVVATTRVLLGVHFATDVTAGLVLGAGTCLLLSPLAEQDRQPRG